MGTQRVGDPRTTAHAGVGVGVRATSGPDTANGIVEDVRRFLATGVVEGFECEHGDLGYGFGAWSKAFLRELGVHGWIGSQWPKEYGGLGRAPQELYRFLQELAYAHGPAEALIYTLAVGGAVLRFGTDRLKSDVIPSAVRGEITFAEALCVATDRRSLDTGHPTPIRTRRGHRRPLRRWPLGRSA